MTEHTGAPARDDEQPEGYDDMLAEVEATIAWIDSKLESGRIRDPERARARQGYLRIKIQAIAEWRKLKEATDLEELQEEVEELKDARERVPA